MHAHGFKSLAGLSVAVRRAHRAVRWVWVLGFVAAVCWQASAAQPVQARTAPPAAPAKEAPAPVADTTFIKSVFDDGPQAGKDPFFPRSERMNQRRVAASPTADLADLVLKGISVTPTKRLAMINNCTLAVGEEADIRAGGKLYRIRCVEIRDNSVIIQYRGVTKELNLRKGF